MICANCHTTIQEPEFGCTINGQDFFAICPTCATNIPDDPKCKAGVRLFRKNRTNHLELYKLIPAHVIIKHWQPFARNILKVPIADEIVPVDVTKEQLQSLATKFQEVAKRYPIESKQDQQHHWKAAQEQGLTNAFRVGEQVFTMLLTHHPHDDLKWGCSVSSPYLEPLPDDFCTQIAAILMPVRFKKLKLHPDSPTTQFWSSDEITAKM